MNLNDLAYECNDIAQYHGWWDDDRKFPEVAMMCVTELAEAVEEYRNHKPMIYEGEDGKPEGIAVEMADCLIRILDWCGHEGIDINKIVRQKMKYNESRPYRHGGKEV